MKARVQCPECAHEWEGECAVSWDSAERCSLRIEYREGARPSLNEIGQAMTSIAQLLESVAKNMGGKVSALFDGLDVDDDSVTIKCVVSTLTEREPRS